MSSENVPNAPPANQDARVERFVEFLTANERPLKSYILSLVPDLFDAEQIAQETSLRLWQQFGEFDPAKGGFAAWARTIAHFQVLSFRKKASRERVVFDSDLLETLDRRAADQADYLATRQALIVDGVNRLPEHSRELIRLYYFVGMKLSAAAEQLGRSVKATEMAVVRIRRVLHDCVQNLIRREGRA